MMVILGPLAGLTTSAVTLTPASVAASLVTVPPSTTSNGVRSMLSPGAPVTLSISRTSPTDTFSWRPPARTIAYTGHSLSMVSETARALEPSRSSRVSGAQIGGRTNARSYRLGGSPPKSPVGASAGRRVQAHTARRPGRSDDPAAVPAAPGPRRGDRGLRRRPALLKRLFGCGFGCRLGCDAGRLLDDDRVGRDVLVRDS